MTINNHSGAQPRIRGKVQGVGFRPYVWQLAQRFTTAWRCVVTTVTVCGCALYRKIRRSLLRSCINTAHRWRALTALRVNHSPGCSSLPIFDSSKCWRYDEYVIVPDAATCPGMPQEMNTPANVVTDTPLSTAPTVVRVLRLSARCPTIVRFTVMASFPLCAQCDKEYRDPYDRRFHAQPVVLSGMRPPSGSGSAGERAEKEEALQAAVSLLKAGGIVAVKGIGGFICVRCARNDNA